MPTIRLDIEYEGTDFSGFVVQAEPDRVKTIQAEIETALEDLTKEKLRLRYASRTDKGVHARGQVAAFDVTRDDIPVLGYQRGLTTKMPPSIVIRKATLVEPGWDPKRTARGKRYTYTYYNDEQPSAIERRTTWWVREKLDVDAMHLAAQNLIGHHDFDAFRAHDCVARHARRLMYEMTVVRTHPYVVFTVLGNAFVKNMVRIFAGTLRDVGRKKISPDDIPDIIASKDRTRAGMTAPARGLVLEEVIYDDRLPERPRST